MSKQSLQIIAAYGEAMFYAHLIEDLLRLHLLECGFFRVNGCRAISKRRIKAMDFEKVINALATIYPHPECPVADLHRIRKIRNHLTHAFVSEIGSDLLTEEGRDQIHAMLRRVIAHARRHLRALQKTHELILREGLRWNVGRVLSRKEPEFDARVARSNIEAWLRELDATAP